MLFAEAMGPAFNTAEIKVFGTDLDEKAVSYGRRGVYTADQIEGVPKRLRERWFETEGPGFALRKEIRRAVVFGVHNLTSDAPISRLDLLVCRNVFIYLNAPLQKRVLTRFHYALRRNGVLVLGKSELIPFAGKIFEPVDLGQRIYRRDGRRDAALSQVRLVNLLEQETVSRGDPAEPAPTEQFHRDVLQALELPVVATTADGTVLSWNGAAVALWGRSEAEVQGKRLASLGLPGLSGELLVERTARVREGRSPREEGIGSLTRAGHPALQLSVAVMPLRPIGSQEIEGLVYLAQDVTVISELKSELNKVNAERQSANDELQTINEELQSSNEELETTNEELQSANEELQTTNEELQSTNEELETINEEMQSTNAELDTTNRELAARTDEMNQLAFLQRTIIRTLSSAVIVIDAKGRITMWNLSAERLLGVAEQEATGQNLWTLHLPSLSRAVVNRLRKVLSQNKSIRSEEVHYEMPNGATGQALMAAVPIMDDGEAKGSVILFDDTTRLRSVTSELTQLKAKTNGSRQAD
jgi:two-component system CheB/CheR fusion protein